MDTIIGILVLGSTFVLIAIWAYASRNEADDSLESDKTQQS